MITVEQLRIFEHYLGDLDGWVRLATDQEKTIMDDQHWNLISEFVQEIILIKNDNVSYEYQSKVNSRLQESCSSSEAVELLKSIAIKMCC